MEFCLDDANKLLGYEALELLDFEPIRLYGHVAVNADPFIDEPISSLHNMAVSLGAPLKPFKTV